MWRLVASLTSAVHMSRSGLYPGRTYDIHRCRWCAPFAHHSALHQADDEKSLVGLKQNQCSRAARARCVTGYMDSPCASGLLRTICKIAFSNPKCLRPRNAATVSHMKDSGRPPRMCLSTYNTTRPRGSVKASDLPALLKGWHGKPAQSTSTAGAARKSSCVTSSNQMHGWCK